MCQVTFGYGFMRKIDASGGKLFNHLPCKTTPVSAREHRRDTASPFVTIAVTFWPKIARRGDLHTRDIFR